MGGLESSARTHWRDRLTDVCVALLPQPSWAGRTPLEAASGPAPHWAAFGGGAGRTRPLFRSPFLIGRLGEWWRRILPSAREGPAPSRGLRNRAGLRCASLRL